ncbi:JmjC domain-containing protein 4 [Vanrija pseudolonga]|uniref:JmjC domain-containing protein 4 n=1 Tax=Vanrija pseudolonga TaxID=143232 RepID=A0AAF1BFC8_9TREE|nr:JmjC domain-containing protein 4 [Vanrija pseudolonga]
MGAPLPSALSDAERAELLRDVPVRPFPTYDDLPYPDFYREHLVPNTPFLLSAAATVHWPARTAWVAGELPNLPSLCAFADQVVPVANTAEREFSEFERSERPLGEVLDAWESGDGASLYVKDWHLVAELELAGQSGREVYAPPPCFRDDWLSPPFDTSPSSKAAAHASTADFRFVYAGPAGTFTPLHRDVYGSYSWSANVVGRKLWWLFPPGTEHDPALRDSRDELLFDVRGLPAEAKGVKVLQEAGEVIFVPSGWHHQVVNLDFCISINHNFFSSATLSRVYDALRVSEARCAAAIDDVRGDIKARLGSATVEIAGETVPAWEAEWAAEVDGLLARDAGWGWAGFWGCVLENIMHPPTSAELSPPTADRDAFVRAVLDKFKASSEWRLLPEARAIAAQVEELLAAPSQSTL